MVGRWGWTVTWEAVLQRSHPFSWCEANGGHFTCNVYTIAASLAESPELVRKVRNHTKSWIAAQECPAPSLGREILNSLTELMSIWYDWMPITSYDRMTLWPSAVSQISQKTLRLSVLGWNAFEAAPAAPAAPAPVVELLPFRSGLSAFLCNTRINYWSAQELLRAERAPLELGCHAGLLFMIEELFFFILGVLKVESSCSTFVIVTGAACITKLTDVSMCRQKLYSKFPSQPKPAPKQTQAVAVRVLHFLYLLITCSRDLRRQHSEIFRALIRTSRNQHCTRPQQRSCRAYLRI